MYCCECLCLTAMLEQYVHLGHCDQRLLILVLGFLVERLVLSLPFACLYAQASADGKRIWYAKQAEINTVTCIEVNHIPC